MNKILSYKTNYRFQQGKVFKIKKKVKNRRNKKQFQIKKK